MILDFAPTELLVIGAVALIVIPPKDLPRAMRFAGQWMGRARGLARQFRSGFDDMIREAEFAEMEQKWKAENERIMREFPDTNQLMAPVPLAEGETSAVGDPGPVMTAQPEVAPAPEPEPEPAPAPKPRKPRVKADIVTPAPRPRASRAKAKS